MTDNANPGSLPPAPAAQPASTVAANSPPDDYRQEIRFAVVMYGGVSLAVYIHGVAQELLRLVRATSGADLGKDKDEVAAIYRKISRLVRNQDPLHCKERCPTRFVIDILSGTSAGGINAIFLAKAIAIRSRNLEYLRRTWLEVADMDKLLNTGGPFEPKRSLLRGDWMYQQLKQAFQAMNNADLTDPEMCYRPEKLDLFVTTTDLNGAAVPIRLADMDVSEKVHKGCFNFRLDNIPLKSKDPVDKQLSNLTHDDFQPDMDPMLAFAARCTSSFPVAFAPMKLVDIKPEMGEEAYDQQKKNYEEFFRWVPRGPSFPQPCADPTTRELADGGYLDNKPFSHAIDAMTFRASRLPHVRKLFYVDPFPEVTEDETCRAHFNFVENGLAAATVLPRYQTIREEIDRIEFSNITQERLHRLRKTVHQNIDDSQGSKDRGENFRKTFNAMFVPPPDQKVATFQTTRVSRLVARYGALYATYHEVRLLDVTDDLSRTVSATHETAQSRDFFLALRYLVRVWRQENYAPNAENGKQLENQFFTEYDYSFRLRRAVRLLEWAQGEKIAEVCDSLIQQLTRLLRTRERLTIPQETVNPIWKLIGNLGRDLGWDEIKAILEPGTDDARYEKAKTIYEKHRPVLDTIAKAIKEQWEAVFELNRNQLGPLLNEYDLLKKEYQLFDFDDMVSLAFLEASNVSEHTETKIYRISPLDGIQRDLNNKLAGYALGNFGAFLEKDWRQNDMFWGRLDASERIVSALLTDPDDQACKDEFIKSLREAIVKQEAARWDKLEPALQAIEEGTLTQYLTDKYKLPDPPIPAKSASQMAKAADILGRMVEEDVGVKNSMTAKLRFLGRAGVRVIALVVPGSLGRVFFNYWLELLGVMSALMALGGYLGRKTEVERFGLYSLASVIVLALIALAIGDFLTQKSTSDNMKWRVGIVPFIRWIPAMILTLLVIIGCIHFVEDSHALWDRIYGILVRLQHFVSALWQPDLLFGELF